jgi:hypothetical protein
MRTVVLTLPELAFIAATRGALGLGIGLLVSGKIAGSRRRPLGWSLFLLGLAATVPAARRVFGGRAGTNRAERPHTPPELVEKDGGKILEVTVTGRLQHSDYERFVPVFERLTNQHGKLRVLFHMIDFHGWQPAALADDIKFDSEHFADIERLAFVGDKAWEKGMSVVCRPFTSATIRYFDRSEIEDARAWLRDGA